MVQVASRASWGARHRDGDGGGTNPATEVFIHHTVTAHLAANATVAAEQAQMRHIEQVGQNRFGRGISYHAIIFPSGRAYQGVSWGNRGTQAANRNSTSRGIAFAGNYETTPPTDAAIATAAALVAHGRGRWWTQGAAVRPHQDIAATACPGRHVLARMNEIRSGAVTPGPTPPPAPPGGLLRVDGWWGPLTTRRLQTFAGTTVDGRISSQAERDRVAVNRGGLEATTWQWVANNRATGSDVINWLQGRIGVRQTRFIGVNTVTALQRHLGTQPDGFVSGPSNMVRALQTRLNEGRL